MVHSGQPHLCCISHTQCVRIHLQLLMFKLPDFLVQSSLPGIFSHPLCLIVDFRVCVCDLLGCFMDLVFCLCPPGLVYSC